MTEMTEKREDPILSFCSKMELEMFADDLDDGCVSISRCRLRDQDTPEGEAGIPAYAIMIYRHEPEPAQLLGLFLSEREMEYLKVHLDRFLQSHDDEKDD